ncbi:hypothetical protein Hamer_G009118 [Homarus americanus]|uniref:Uncharacterized protein n=1 Tax=Homarus americanus TaxID=6706 RepID=A0A8J5TJT0_HOMAM|nr:hypothetical protein Hamer_G009118 [Homarus americanus]
MLYLDRKSGVGVTFWVNGEGWVRDGRVVGEKGYGWGGIEDRKEKEEEDECWREGGRAVSWHGYIGLWDTDQVLISVQEFDHKDEMITVWKDV